MMTRRVTAVGAAALVASAGGTAAVLAAGPEGSKASPQAATAAVAKPLSGKVIVIDPGHNGLNHKYPKKINRQVPAGPFTKACDTTGTATNSGYTEHAYTFDVAQRVAKILRAQGATVRLTRPNDRGVGPCVNERAAIANRLHADAAISIHADGAPSARRGFHVIMPGYVKGYTGPIVAPSKRLGLDVRAAFHKVQPYANYVGGDGIDVRKDLGGLNLSKSPRSSSNAATCATERTPPV